MPFRHSIHCLKIMSGNVAAEDIVTIRYFCGLGTCRSRGHSVMKSGTPVAAYSAQHHIRVISLCAAG